MNMVQNLLLSMDSQEGMSGPASNLLTMLYKNNSKYKNKKT